MHLFHTGLKRRIRALAFLAVSLTVLPVFAQEAVVSPQDPAVSPGAAAPPSVESMPAGTVQTPPVIVDKRAFGVLPNYRTADSANPFERVDTKGKFLIATKDSFDLPVLPVTMFFAGISQLNGSDNQTYGQGLKGFAHRTGISYADQVIGNYFPEAIVPSLFHLDPRYYRRGTGSVRGRLFYAVSRIFICKSDSGNWTFNANEFVGNSLAAMTASAYHPHERTPGDMITQAATYIETDMAGQLIREFWPDVKRRLFKHRRQDPQP